MFGLRHAGRQGRETIIWAALVGRPSSRPGTACQHPNDPAITSTIRGTLDHRCPSSILQWRKWRCCLFSSRFPAHHMSSSALRRFRYCPWKNNPKDLFSSRVEQEKCPSRRVCRVLSSTRSCHQAPRCSAHQESFISQENSIPNLDSIHHGLLRRWRCLAIFEGLEGSLDKYHLEMMGRKCLPGK